MEIRLLRNAPRHDSTLILQKISFRAVTLKVMKSKRAKTKISPIKGVKPTAPEKCWYCGFNADAGAEAAILLTKPDDDFQYFAPDPEEKKQIITQVEIPRCIECKTAHNKVSDPRSMRLFICLTGIALLGIYLGIFIKRLPWWIYSVIGLFVSGAVIGLAIGVNRNLFMLPGKMKPRNDVEKQKEVQALLLKDWEVKS